MNQINSIIPFVFEDKRLRINNKPVLVPSNNPAGHTEKHHAFTLMSDKFDNNQDLLNTIHSIGLDINPEYLKIRKRSYQIKYKEDVEITVEDMYQDKLTDEFKSNYTIGIPDIVLSINKP